jgi:hypothetical protein
VSYNLPGELSKDKSARPLSTVKPLLVIYSSTYCVRYLDMDMPTYTPRLETHHSYIMLFLCPGLVITCSHPPVACIRD